MKSSDDRMAVMPLSLISPRRNLNFCFPKLKLPLWSHAHPSPSVPAAAATPTSTLMKTFNSLYDSAASNFTSVIPSSSSSSTLSSDPELSPAYAPEPDFSAIYASQRFFFSSPGRSNSIVECPPRPELAARAEIEPPDPVFGGGVAVPTYSPDPYADFRRSMQEMVNARKLFDVKSDWDCLHELLRCYLSLNPKSTHKFIVGAFSDLLVSLMCEARGGRQSYGHRRHHR